MNALKKLTVLTGLLSALFAIPMMAQIINRVTFDAPSTFYAGNTKLPAGRYTVSQPDDDSSLLLIEDASGAHSVFVEYVVASSDNPEAHSNVTFNKYGNVEFLTGISVDGENEMHVVPSKAEQIAAKKAAVDKHSLSARSGSQPQ
jgi:hypothetical protein